MVFRAILETNGTDQEALFGMGGVYFKKGDRKRAAEAWLNLKVLNPSYPNIEGWLSQVQPKSDSSQQLIPPPPPRQAPTAAPPPTQRPAPRAWGESDQEGLSDEEDWRKQAVRVDRTDLPLSEAPAPAETPPPSDVDTKGEDDLGKWMGGKVPVWVVPTGWALVLVYVGVIALIYFS
jgi:hypothetical protein